MACCGCQFITQTDFYGIVPLSRNVESEDIEIAIKNAQITYINQLLCQDLFDELCQQITDEDIRNAVKILKKTHYKGILFFAYCEKCKDVHAGGNLTAKDCFPNLRNLLTKE